MINNNSIFYRLLYFALERILSPSKITDYIVLLLYSLFVFIMSFYVGVAYDVGDFRGYLSSINWLTLTFGLPFFLLFTRNVFGKIFPLKGPQKPPLVDLLSFSESKDEFNNKLRKTLINPYNIITSFIIIICLQFIDTYRILCCYLSYITYKFSCVSPESGWSIYFMICGTNVSILLNLLFFILAYSIQFFVGFLGILLIVLFCRYNCFFLTHIYQRRLVHDINKKLFIVINLNDPEQCFGFRKIHEGFNYQIGSIVLTGVVIISSRMINVKQSQSINFYNSLAKIEFSSHFWNIFKIISELNISELFPDIGQWILLIVWIIFFLVIFIPALIKWLPLLRLDHEKKVPKMIVDYIKEFIPEEQWPYGDNPSIEEINILAGKYAKNSFWPSGDNRARLLFFFAFLTGWFILLPIKPIWGYFYHFIFWFGMIVSTSFVLTALLFKILKLRVGYIDERLIGSKL